ncbi:MAG TPA: response regulator [Ktedonobacterales bacterium]|nr:response regulator [Ktedonobacterales bacterium]
MAHMPTVLIVDDEAPIRTMLAEMLKLEGVPFETAGNGREALDLLARGEARIVLLDLSMPVLDGRGMLQELEASPVERAKHKIILMSALTRLEANRDLIADGILSKPFTLPQLLSVLESVSAQVH